MIVIQFAQVSRYSAKFRREYFRFLDFSSIGHKENVHNSGTNDGINMKLGPVTKLDKRNKTTSKEIKMTSRQQIVTPLSIFQFIANLEQSESSIPDA